MHDGSYLNFRSAGTALVLDCTGGGLPRVVHWGADLGELGQDAMASLARAAVPQIASNNVDLAVPLSLLPEHSAGWQGTPGLTGHRAGADFSTAFAVTSLRAEGRSLAVVAEDVVAALELRLEIELTESGLVRQRARLTSLAEDGGALFTLGGLLLALPVPERATELLDMTGRHLRERTPQRHAFTIGTHLRDNRKGRTGTDAVTVHIAGEAGFGFRSGEVWGLHVGWSGNHRSLAERTHTGVSLLAGGELPLAGEIALGAGESYTSPWVFGSYGRAGLDELAGRFHGYLRARPHHPSSPRPVTLNVWEAVYFNHDLPRLKELADAAAEIGAERFVLDDGWFRGRRDDHAGLGDWYVDETVWPDGLHPLVGYVRGLGLEFGLWVEPEMVNVNSDLARAHPEWIMATGDRLPPESRHQQVLDLGHPEAYAYILERLDSLVGEYELTYLKWDHNRDLVEAGHSPTGRAGVHAQTLAVYRLMDELRKRHPNLEIESCSSGGGRVDLGILERTDRVWTSDCIDALERQLIQRWTGVLLPPELMGSHVGAPEAHTTGRTHGLEFRAGTALFGHFGIEWDLTSASPEDRAALAEWIALHKRLRPLLHTGRVVREDHPDPALWVHGVVAEDGGHAVFALAQVATSVQSPPGRVRLPGLEPDATYRLAPLAPADRPRGPAMDALAWWGEGVTLPGRVLSEVGVRAPIQNPERLVLLEARRVGS
ncbi:alpha-galactosidase [Streptomyces sp. 3MP-14]|uniref:Alpha-galactosidase n=1 Tax=Streptomyces mimosae TaxID=2586635 RepID=A0A5N6AGV5_9ACTN|nr:MULTISPECIES: alpha-galactosidase [Streptomyces]KAB8167080.1 alpha-galactosidase [Streptomyces mimosae]KAB8177021.1 alpha-galactosidase [Streptomyces sp. 3MP-14]